MKIDFLDQYKDHSTAELLRIMKQPHHYQPEAIAAAKQLLATRNISEEEIAFAEEDVQESKLPIDELKTNLVETLRPLLTAGVKPTPEQWFRLVLLACGIELVISAYSVLSRIIALYFYSNVYIGYPLLSYLGQAIGGLSLTLLIFCCIYRKLRMGWILFYVFNLVVMIATLSRLVQPSIYSYGTNEIKIIFDAILLLIRVTMAVVMWKQEVAVLFRIRKTDKGYAVLAAVLLIALIIVLSYMRH